MCFDLQGENHGYINRKTEMTLPYTCGDPKGSREEAPMKRLNILVMMLVACGFAGLAGSTANADIYVWTDENGVKNFTNQAPPEHATLFMRTPELPHDEEADTQRRNMDRLETAIQALAEREALLLEQQQEAERRIAAANARAEAALRDADQILQEAEAASEGEYHGYSGSYGWDYSRRWYGSGSRYLYKGYKRWDGGLYRKKHHHRHKTHHYKNKRHHSKYKKHIKPHTKRSHYKSHRGSHHVRRHSTAIRGRAQTHRSRSAAFRGRHGRF